MKNCVVVKMGLKKYPSAPNKQLFVWGCTISRHVAGAIASLKYLLNTLILSEWSACHTRPQLYSNFTSTGWIGSRQYTNLTLDQSNQQNMWIINQTVDFKSLDDKQNDSLQMHNNI